MAIRSIKLSLQRMAQYTAGSAEDQTATITVVRMWRAGEQQQDSPAHCFAQIYRIRIIVPSQVETVGELECWRTGLNSGTKLKPEWWDERLVSSGGIIACYVFMFTR